MGARTRREEPSVRGGNTRQKTDRLAAAQVQPPTGELQKERERKKKLNRIEAKEQYRIFDIEKLGVSSSTGRSFIFPSRPRFGADGTREPSLCAGGSPHRSAGAVIPQRVE